MNTIKDFILDTIFPRHCLGCDILLEGDTLSYICRHCSATITLKNDFACAFCKSPVVAGKTCPFCIKEHFLDRLFVTTSYENPLVEKILKTMKYRFVRLLADDIANLMIEYLEKKRAVLQLGPATIVTPVPLHRKRLNWRGFNQAEIAATKIGDTFGWPVITDALQRCHNRKPQANIPDRLSRIKNARNLFELHSTFLHRRSEDNALTDKTIFLVDDISTTGSTLDDCARALKGAGAKEVIGFVFARNKLDKSYKAVK